MSRRFSSSTGTPPPVATTAPPSAQTSANASRSSARKAGSPSASKISGIDRAARRSMRSSRSMNDMPSRSAASCPAELLPLYEKPMRNRLRIAA